MNAAAGRLLPHDEWKIRGKKVTSTPGIRDDMTNAGGIWADEETVVDGNIVSGRRPPDLPAYAKAFIKVVSSGKVR